MALPSKTARRTTRPEVAAAKLLRPAEAARLLGVSVSYLRDSSCPKVMLPSKGRGFKPFIRYVPAEVLAWAMENR